MTRGGLTQTGRRQTSSGPRGKARAARGIAARQFIGEAKFGFRHAARRALPLGRALGYWRLLHRELYLHLVERFVLRHQVFRSGRDPSDYVREAADVLEAYRVADLLAECTTRSPWRQELRDVHSGGCWARSAGLGWTVVLADDEALEA